MKSKKLMIKDCFSSELTLTTKLVVSLNLLSTYPFTILDCKSKLRTCFHHVKHFSKIFSWSRDADVRYRFYIRLEPLSLDDPDIRVFQKRLTKMDLVTKVYTKRPDISAE